MAYLIFFMAYFINQLNSHNNTWVYQHMHSLNPQLNFTVYNDLNVWQISVLREQIYRIYPLMGFFKKLMILVALVYFNDQEKVPIYFICFIFIAFFLYTIFNKRIYYSNTQYYLKLGADLSIIILLCIMLGYSNFFDENVTKCCSNSGIPLEKLQETSNYSIFSYGNALTAFLALALIFYGLISLLRIYNMSIAFIQALGPVGLKQPEKAQKNLIKQIFGFVPHNEQQELFQIVDDLMSATAQPEVVVNPKEPKPSKNTIIEHINQVEGSKIEMKLFKEDQSTVEKNNQVNYQTNVDKPEKQ